MKTVFGFTLLIFLYITMFPIMLVIFPFTRHPRTLKKFLECSDDFNCGEYPIIWFAWRPVMCPFSKRVFFLKKVEMMDRWNKEHERYEWMFSNIK